MFRVISALTKIYFREGHFRFKFILRLFSRRPFSFQIYFAAIFAKAIFVSNLFCAIFKIYFANMRMGYRGFPNRNQRN